MIEAVTAMQEKSNKKMKKTFLFSLIEKQDMNKKVSVPKIFFYSLKSEVEIFLVQPHHLKYESSESNTFYS